MPVDQRDQELIERGKLYRDLKAYDVWRDYFVPDVYTIIREDLLKLRQKSTDWEETKRLRTRIEAMEQVLGIPDQTIKAMDKLS